MVTERKQPGSRKGAWILISIAVIVFAIPASILIYLVSLHHELETQLRSPQWIIPSTLYAEPPLLAPGTSMGPQDLVRYFDKLEYHREKSGELTHGGDYQVTSDGIAFRRRHIFLRKNETPSILVRFDGNTIRELVDLRSG